LKSMLCALTIIAYGALSIKVWAYRHAGWAEGDSCLATLQGLPACSRRADPVWHAGTRVKYV
jgi:hypothetical protein